MHEYLWILPFNISFFPPLHRSFTSLTSYRANPSVKSQTKGSKSMRVRRRMNFFLSASKSRFVSSTWRRFHQPLSLYFSSFFKEGVVQNYLQKLIIICNIVSGRRIARIEWTEPETRGGEWAIQTGNFMIQLIDICCFDLFNNHIFPTGFHETMVGGSQTSRGVLVHTSEGVIDNIHLLNVAKYPKKLIADEPQIPQDSNNVVLLAHKLWNQTSKLLYRNNKQNSHFWLASILKLLTHNHGNGHPHKGGVMENMQARTQSLRRARGRKQTRACRTRSASRGRFGSLRFDLHLGHSQGQKPQTNPGKWRSIQTYVKCQISLSQPDHQDISWTQLVHIHHWTFFKLFVSNEPTPTICHNTNKQAKESIANGKKYSWTKINLPDFFRYVGLSFFFCVVETE